jgi:hypothetical protein
MLLIGGFKNLKQLVVFYWTGNLNVAISLVVILMFEIFFVFYEAPGVEILILQKW